MLRENLNTLFERLKEQDPRLTPYKVCQETGINHPNFKSALEGGRPFSEPNLIKLAEHPSCPYTADQLLAWKMLDEYPENVLKEALRALPVETRVSIIAETAAFDSKLLAQVNRVLKEKQGV